MTLNISRKLAVFVLCLAALLICFQIADAKKSSRTLKYSRNKAGTNPAEKTATHEKAAAQENTAATSERAAIVNVASSDVFARHTEESECVTQVLLGDEFRVVREEKDWAYGYIPSQKGYHGWIRKDHITHSTDDFPFKDKTLVQVKNAKARITFRDGSFLNVYAGTRLPLLNKDNRRYEVIVPDGSTGYLPVEVAWVENEGLVRDVTANDILQASKFYGSDYKWGGITSGGMDCSGFVYTAFRLNGIFLKRDSYLQAEEGMDVSINDLKAGDLVFFKSGKGNRIGHVGIYIGDGNFIHSSKGKKGVSVSSLSDEYFKKRFAGARRILHSLDSGGRLKPATEENPKPENKDKT